MNAMPKRKQSPKDTIFGNFIENNNLSTVANPDKPTFYNHDGKSYSHIDHFLFQNGGEIQNPSVTISDMEPTNTSDHVPIFAKIASDNINTQRDVQLIVTTSKGNTQKDLEDLENALHKAGYRKAVTLKKGNMECGY